jgi:hypothetical protein
LVRLSRVKINAYHQAPLTALPTQRRSVSNFSIDGPDDFIDGEKRDIVI